MKFKVSGETRHFPAEYWLQLEGPKPPKPKEFECNGCSCSPDYFKHYDIWPACVIHDWHYGTSILGPNWAGRREADQILRRNLAKALALQGANKWYQWSIPYIYWGRVRIWAATHYAFSADEKPQKILHRFIEGWGWFRDKRPRSSKS